MPIILLYRGGEKMLSLEIYKTIPITNQKNSLFSSIAFDGCYFYFCDPCHRNIIKYNDCFEEIECIKVKREYTSLCYDFRKKQFYAVSELCYNRIFVLNNCFEEIDSFEVCFKCNLAFRDISYFDGTIYVTSKKHIITVSTRCFNKQEILFRSNCDLLCTAKTPCYLISACQECRGQVIKIYDDLRCLKTTICLPCCYRIRDILYDKKYIYILVNKDCYNFVLVCQICSHCHPCKQECSKDIVESIAQIESSLSQILTAESEKIQKILKISNDPRIILEVNEAVNSTITNITHLEHVLYSKLNIAKELCHEKKKD